ncbi:hypothetical protein D9M69_580630 [compost metagenome]
MSLESLWPHQPDVRRHRHQGCNAPPGSGVEERPGRPRPAEGPARGGHGPVASARISACGTSRGKPAGPGLPPILCGRRRLQDDVRCDLEFAARAQTRDHSAPTAVAMRAPAVWLSLRNPGWTAPVRHGRIRLHFHCRNAGRKGALAAQALRRQLGWPPGQA